MYLSLREKMDVWRENSQLRLTTVPEGHKLGKASTSNPHPEALPAAKQLQQLPACQMDTARGGAQRREKMKQSISLLSDAHDCLSSLPKWGM
ncbi:hypothetical protein DPX16_16900 [Anabarilius grahami]|uniref:Uncharacterized protein n=1 Tax=Anabarilius grahami TaxID=495550 RepID=A0A3N0YM46_ANAGA|nr:hypothetical protein DPX16_16900 [Anabarilius grahami]